MSVQDVFSLEDACAYLKIAKPTLYKYVRIGAVPAFKMGRVWKFHKESLDKWLRLRVEEDTKARSVKSQ